MFTRVDSRDYDALIKEYNDAKKEIIALKDARKAKNEEIEKLLAENERNRKEIEKLKKELGKE